MKRILGCVILLVLVGQKVSAMMVTQFANTDSFVERSKDIIVADCVSIPTNKPTLVNGHWVTQLYADGLYKVEVDVIQTLKGGKQSGHQIIATIYPMSPGKRYLLSSLGGGSIGESEGVAGTDFIAVPQLSVVEIPAGFDLKSLEGKDLKEQVQSMFSRHLYEVERRLAPLLEEKTVLGKAVADRQSEWFNSVGPLKIGLIIDAVTTNEHSLVWLNLDDKKLGWSGSTPGKDGYLYFDNIGLPRKLYWEFSTCDATNIENLANTRLKTKFFGLFSPGRKDQSFRVSVGQVLFARTIDDNTVFCIQIVRQAEDKEQAWVRYAVIQK